MYKILLHKRVIKFINSRSGKEREQIKGKLLELVQNPYPTNQNIDIKKLKARVGFRLRVGGYRFIYDIEEDELVVYIEKAGNRGDIY